MTGDRGRASACQLSAEMAMKNRMNRMNIHRAVIPAAGLGTRFLPATKAQPKEMLPIVDKPAIQFIVEEAQESGIDEILIITGRNKRAIEDHFDRNIELEMQLAEDGKYDSLETIQRIGDTIVHFIRQKETKGLGHAVLCARQFIGNEFFAVLLGDDLVDAEVPCLKQLITAWRDVGGSILGCQEIPRDKVSAYGIVDGVKKKENIWQVKDMIEKPSIVEAPSRLAVLGRYILAPEIFDILEKTEPGKSGEIQLTDALKVLAGRDAVYAYQFTGRRYDIGDKEGFLEATVEQALKRPDLRERFMEYLSRTLPSLVQQEL